VNQQTSRDDDGGRGTLALWLELTPDQLELLAHRVAERLDHGRDHGFLAVDGAAAYLGGISRKAVYHMVERRRIRSRRIGGRLLFDPCELREDVERNE
jgi:excisionase family DNA binding protein